MPTHVLPLCVDPRYIMALKVSDASGEAWLSAFNEQAEKILGYSADELDKLKSEVKQFTEHLFFLCLFYVSTACD